MIIFASFDTKSAKVEQFMSLLTNKYISHGLFHLQKANYAQLALSDVLILRGRNRLDFNIYRKDIGSCKTCDAKSVRQTR